jgi:predicted amidohydrolase
MTESDFRVALCQYALGSADTVAGVCDAAADLFADAGDADLYVLPELLLADAVGEPDGTGDVREHALDATGRDEYHALLRETAEANEAVVVGGSYNVVDGGDAYNRSPVATPDGLVTYDKRHPTPEERSAGKCPGPDEPPVVDHRGVSVGVLNCYDVEFPSTARAVADAGAEVVAVPSWTATEAGVERVVRCGAARAVENQQYVVSVPLVGETESTDGLGRASVFRPCDDVLGPHGTGLTLPRDVSAAAATTLDVAALRESRERASVRPYSDARAGN